ncbi:subclass B1 metallo-beta-lactamase, partial [Bacillus cereus]
MKERVEKMKKNTLLKVGVCVSLLGTIQ